MNKLNKTLFLLTYFVCASAAADKHALLIGIQDYSQTPFESLKGSVNDVGLMKGILRERFGFQDKDFIILLDEKATHSGIEKAFKALTGRVRSNDDFVFVYYSGHGSETPDLNGDEKNGGYDQTWVSYGARRGRDNLLNDYDVLDDEINAWLAAIYQKTDQVVFVSDSCHSATVSRGEVPVSRAVSRDDRPHLRGNIAYTSTQLSHGIRLGAARDDEFALELEKDAHSYGVFTWYWAKALEQAQAWETWYDVFRRTYRFVTAQRDDAQHPQISGGHRQRVLGGGFKALPPTVPIKVIYEGWIEIEAGSLAGVTQGSVYGLYKQDYQNRKACHAQDLPRLTIVEVTPAASYAEPEEEAEGCFQTGDFVIEERHVYEFEDIQVYLEASGEDQALLQTIRSVFQSRSEGQQLFPPYKLTNEPSKTDLRLHLLRPKRENGQLIYASPDDALPKSFPNQAPELWILAPEQRVLSKNLQIPFDNPEAGIGLLRNHLKKLARVRELKALQSPYNGALPVTVQAHVLTSPVNSCQGKDCVRSPLGWHQKRSFPLRQIDGQILNASSFLTFTLDNQSKEEDYYTYLINITPSKAIYVIFPDPEDVPESARIKYEEKRELIKEIVLPMSELGENILLVITLIANSETTPIDTLLLEQPPLVERDWENLSPLARLLVNVVHVLRGENDVSVSNDVEWAAAQVSFEVK
jgi:hypothetical protein